MSISKIAGVVVWYHPVRDHTRNVWSYLDHVDQLYIIDNSENADRELHAAFSELGKVEIIADSQNHGIAAALNIAIKKATAAGYEWLLTMDQDSFFEEGLFQKYLQNCSDYGSPENVALFGLPYDPAFPRKAPPGELYVSVHSMITSGNIVNLAIANELGGFNEQLFIDEVDHDFCYRAGIKGYKIICVRAGLLSHSLGESKEVQQSLSQGTKNTTLHNPQRIYYMVRNGLYIATHFAHAFPAEARKRKKIIYVTIKNNFLHGSNKLAVLKYAALGYLHHKKKRYYKL